MPGQSSSLPPGSRLSGRRRSRVTEILVREDPLEPGCRVGVGPVERFPIEQRQSEVVEALRNGYFRIALDGGHETLGYTAGKMRRYRIRIFPGDRVKIELSPYDLNRGRIVYRYK